MSKFIVQTVNKGRAGCFESCKSGSRGECPETYRSNAARRWVLSLLNSVSFVDGKKLDNNYGMYFDGLRKESDRLCREHKLSVIEEPGRSSGSRYLQQAEKRGEPTLYNVVKSDIDNAIHQSMTDKQFYQKMREWGYDFSFSENRKYPTIHVPGQKHNIRFKTLGENYTPETITHRILENHRAYIPPPQKKPEVRRYRYRGSFQNMKSVSGIYILYLIFILTLRRISNHEPNQRHRTIYTPELRAAIRQMEKYSAETRLLCRHKIETPEQLTVFIGNCCERRKVLEHERSNVYNRMKSTKKPEKLQELKSERDELSAQIKLLRKELFYAHDVFARWRKIQEKLRAQREFQVKQIAQEKAEQIKNKERGHSR